MTVTPKDFTLALPLPSDLSGVLTLTLGGISGTFPDVDKNIDGAKAGDTALAMAVDPLRLDTPARAALILGARCVWIAGHMPDHKPMMVLYEGQEEFSPSASHGIASGGPWVTGVALVMPMMYQMPKWVREWTNPGTS